MSDEAPKAPSIYDVARAAGVSPSTVSRTFSRPGRVQRDTAQRVLEVAAEIGYRTRAHVPPTAVSNRLIALLLPDITNPGYLDLIRGCEDAAYAAGYTLLLASAQELPERERSVTERALRTVDGIVLVSSRMTESAIRQIAKQCPLVMLNRAVRDVPSVMHDNARGMDYALEHLAGLGHTEVAYLAGPESSWANGVRWEALRTAAGRLGVHVRRFGPLAPTFDGGLRGAELWREHPTTAVIGFNDVVALGFMRAARTAGVDVPGDVAVVGFDNANVARLSTPQLTTVASPLHALGETAVRNVLSIVSGARSWTGEPLVLPTRLVVRESTAPPRG